MDEPIGILCPSRDRPESLLRLCRSVKDTSTQARVYAYIDADQYDRYLEAISLDEDIPLTILKGPRNGVVVALNSMAKQIDAKMVGMIADDCIITTPGWDLWMIEQFNRWGSGPCCFNPHHSFYKNIQVDMPFVSRSWVDAVSYFAIPTTKRYAWPHAIELMALRIGRLVNATRDQMHIEHLQESTASSPEYENDSVRLYSWINWFSNIDTDRLKQACGAERS